MGKQENVAVEVRDDAVLVMVSCAEIDEDCGSQLEERVSAAAQKAGRSPVILDLSQVEVIADDALGALVDLLHECRLRGQRFILTGLQPQVLEILSITKLGRLFEYRENLEDAQAHLEDTE